eukprot:6901610-Pyramimonas_sp.AAC.1
MTFLEWFPVRRKRLRMTDQPTLGSVWGLHIALQSPPTNICAGSPDLRRGFSLGTAGLPGS